MKIIEPGFFNRNRKLLLIALAIFLISAVAGAVIANINAGDNINIISNQLNQMDKNNISENSTSSGMSSFDLFTHNFLADMVVVIGGVLFSIISVLIGVFNGFIIGRPFGFDFPFASVSILPHGIIEYTALVFALGAAFQITKLEIAIIKNRNFKDTLKDNKMVLNDILTMIIIMIVLLVIAAIIEAHLTPLISTWFFGL